MTGLKTRKKREDRKSLMRQLKQLFLTKLMLSSKGETRPDSFHNNWQAKAMMGEKTPSGGL